MCAPELASLCPLPLVDIVEEIGQEVERQHLKRIALFGTQFAMTSGLFGRLGAVEIIEPKPEELDYIHDAYIRIVNAGAGTSEDHRALTKLARTLCERDGAKWPMFSHTSSAQMAELVAPAPDRFVPDQHAARGHRLFHVPKTEVKPDSIRDDFSREAMARHCHIGGK
jgi:hypothetical protein